MKILLACSAGMSTSILVNKIKKYGESIGEEIGCEAHGASAAKSLVDKFDIVLLGPQVRYMLKDFQKLVNDKIPVDVIAPRDYAIGNAEAIVKAAKAKLGN